MVLKSRTELSKWLWIYKSHNFKDCFHIHELSKFAMVKSSVSFHWVPTQLQNPLFLWGSLPVTSTKKVLNNSILTSTLLSTYSLSSFFPCPVYGQRLGQC